MAKILIPFLVVALVTPTTSAQTIGRRATEGRSLLRSALEEARKVGPALSLQSAGAPGPAERQVRLLSSFESVYIPDGPNGGSGPTSGTRLTRELRESLIQQAKVRWSPMPFNWTVVDSIGSDTTRTLVATAQPDPARRSGIVILFADTSGNSVAAIPARTIRAAMDVLIELSRRTTGGADRYPPASRLSGTFSVMHLRYQSPLGRTNDEFKLLARLKSRLRTRGPWDLVDSMPVEGDPRRMHTLQCVAWNAGGIPTSVGLTCSAVLPSDPNRREIVLRMISHSCRGCYSADIVFSSEKTRVFAATDDLARDVLAHLELEQQIYSPQRADRLR